MKCPFPDCPSAFHSVHLHHEDLSGMQIQLYRSSAYSPSMILYDLKDKFKLVG